MTRKVITFLGINPRDAIYKWKGKTYPARVTAQAIREFAQFDQMLVFVTPGAMSGTFSILAELHDDRIKPVEIVDGKDTESMWQIFQTVVEHVQEGETVIFDITHGFRSLPFLAFLFIAYLKSAKNVIIEAVYYGALDMKKDDVTPILDLSEFTTMLDWLTAADQFTQTGNAYYLASQLTKNSSDDLIPLAENVTEIALGLELLRPRDVSKSANDLPERVKALENNMPQPFGVVASSLIKSYAQFGVEDTNNLWDSVRSQQQMINWYIDKQHYVHALSMSREWVISLLCVHFKEDLWSKEDRDDIELLLNGSRKNDEGTIIAESRHVSEWQKDNRRKVVANLWQGVDFKLANLRNDVLHSGFRKKPGKAEDIIKQSKRIADQINAIADLWNF